jgi:hypothetical protein
MMWKAVAINDCYGARITLLPNNIPRHKPIPIISPPKWNMDLGVTKVYTPPEYDAIGFSTVTNGDIYSKDTLSQFEYREKAMLVREPKNSKINNLISQLEPNNWL